ncbi:MAG: hypothetical protein LUG45_04525, partial [Clostridiales bacterium]|nr:hypothetical protein [Clostridiales bacterium]
MGIAMSLAPLKGNVINLRVKLHLSKEKIRFRAEKQISTTNGNSECYPAAMGGSLSRYQVTSSAA